MSILCPGDFVPPDLLEFHVQSRAPNRRQRHPMRASTLHQEDRSVFHAGQPAREVRLAVDRRRRHDLRQPSDEPSIVLFVPQRAIQSW